MTEAVRPNHGSLYWILRHAFDRSREAVRNHRRGASRAAFAAAVLAVLFRATLHGLVIAVRCHIAPLAIVTGIGAGALSLARRRSRWAKLGAVIGGSFFVALLCCGRELYAYLQLYSRYSSLHSVDLAELPVTDHERIQPARSVSALAHDAVSEGEAPIGPDFVRVGNEYVWSLAIEPAYLIPRITRGVDALINVPGSAASASFSTARRIPVHFVTGEHLLADRNAAAAAIRTFGFFRYLSDEPAEVQYLPDEHGDWVQVVTLVHWSGWLFPIPEFGGVQVIRESRAGITEHLRLLLFGAGEWIPADQVGSAAFLRGQNILPRQVSRVIAESLRFQNGFLAPFPGYHEGDIRIPRLDADVNPQPFIGYFQGRDPGSGKLYHYFALEPADMEKQGLNTSVFVPADGIGPVAVYRHFDRGEVLSGVTSISTKVMESRKSYDWNRNRPVEHRPFIRMVEGKPRFFWLTTVVTARLGESKERFIAGSVPEVAITDAGCNIPVWVNAREPGGWMAQLQQELEGQWKHAPGGE